MVEWLSMESDNFLPNLKNEKTGEQIVFKQKVYRSNEAFKKKIDALILWHKSPSDCQIYPAQSKKNHCTYRKSACLFEYDSKKSVLYKKVKNSDGIGKLFAPTLNPT